MPRYPGILSVAEGGVLSPYACSTSAAYACGAPEHSTMWAVTSVCTDNAGLCGLEAVGYLGYGLVYGCALQAGRAGIPAPFGLHTTTWPLFSGPLALARLVLWGGHRCRDGSHNVVCGIPCILLAWCGRQRTSMAYFTRVLYHVTGACVSSAVCSVCCAHSCEGESGECVCLCGAG